MRTTQEKKDKAYELLNKRYERVSEQLRLLGNLGNKQNYRLTESQVDSLELLLHNEVALTINRLRKNKIANFSYDIPKISQDETIGKKNRGKK